MDDILLHYDNESMDQFSRVENWCRWLVNTVCDGDFASARNQVNYGYWKAITRYGRPVLLAMLDYLEKERDVYDSFRKAGIDI